MLQDNPNSPAYVRDELRRVLPELKLVGDCWAELKGAESEYLPREAREPDAAYRGRLQRSVYPPFYRQALEGITGLLANHALQDLPATLEASQKDVDRRGNSLSAFLAMADAAAMRDGAAPILVEMPPRVTLNSAAEQVSLSASPYLVLLDRRNVINWRTELVDGRERLLQVTIREVRQVPDGQFGVKTEDFYRVMVPGAWAVFRVVGGPGGERVEQVQAGETSLPFIPLVWYTPKPAPFGLGELPFLQMARLTLQHHACRSDLIELLHRCAMPVPVRVGAMITDTGAPPPLVIGPNSVVDVPEGGAFTFAEPGGGSLAIQQQNLAHIERLIAEQTLRFLQSGEAGKTATEAALNSSQTTATLQLLVSQKQSLFEEIVRIWCAYTGEEPTGEMQIDPSVLQTPLDPNGISQLVNLYNSKLLSRQSVLEQLRLGGVLPVTFDVESEVATLEQEETMAMQRMIDQQTAALTNADLGGPLNA
jgi:hypothetical protein